MIIGPSIWSSMVTPILGVGSTLKKIEPSTVFDIDFTNGVCYSEGQTGKDAIGKAPFTLGADDTPSTDDPTILYAGTPQGKAVFGLGDTIKGTTTPNFWLNAAKTDEQDELTFVIAFKTGDSFSTNQWFATTYEIGDDNGVGFRIDASGVLTFWQSGSGYDNAVTLGTLEVNTYYKIVVSIKKSTYKLRHAINSDTFTEVAFVYDATDADNIGWSLSGFLDTSTSGFLPDTELFRFAGIESYLDDTRLAAINTQLVTDHQELFPPSTEVFTPDSLDNVINYSEFFNSNNLELSGSDVLSVERTKGTVSFTNGETSAMEYDATLFGNVGGIKTVDAESDINYGGNSGAPATTTIAFVISNVAATDAYVFSIGGSGFGSSSCFIRHSGSGRFRYYSPASGGATEIRADDGKVGTFIFILEYVDADTLNCTIIDDDGVEVETTLNPNDAYQDNIVWLGDRGNGDGGVGFGYAEFLQTSDVLTTDEKNNLKGFWDNKYLGGAWALNNASLYADESIWLLIGNDTRLRYR